MKIVLADITWDDLRLNELVRHTEYLDENMIKQVKTEALPILLSYWYVRNSKKAKDHPVINSIRNAKASGLLQNAFYVDSGVYSARRKGVVITVDEFIDWFNSGQADVVDHIFNMDHGDKDEQLANCRRMKEAGLPVIGIWHGAYMNNPIGKMDFSYIDKFLEITDYIAFGAPFKNKDDGERYLDMAFNYIHKNNLWPIKIHGLGMEVKRYITRFPFYSVDSSSFAQNYAFGKISYYHKESYRIKTLHAKEQYDRALKLDITSMKCAGTSGASRTERVKQNIGPRFELQDMMTKYWSKNGIDWK